MTTGGGADYRQVAEAIPQQVWTAEPGGRLDFVNRRVLDYLARTLEDVLANGWQDAIHPDDAGAVKSEWQRALAEGVPYETEFRLRRAIDGAYRWHLGRALPVRDETGSVVRWFGTNTDIDDQKRAIEARDNLIAVVSRDLKNPIALVVSSAGHLSKALPPEMRAERQHVDTIRRIADRMQGIVHSVLDLEHLRGGRMILDRRPCDPTALVLEAFEVHRARASQKAIRLERDTPPRLSVSCDAKRVVQALGQLFSYAVDNAPNGGKVTVRVVPDGTTTTFYVSDSGRALRPDQLEAVFDRSWRPGGGDAEVTGLGLATCKAIIEAHGGSVHAENENGSTQFVLTLRVAVS